MGGPGPGPKDKGPRRIGNENFAPLRSFLYPGSPWSSSPPRQVDDHLHATIDIENWVPVPRYWAVCASPIPTNAGWFSSVGIENFKNPGGAPLPYPLTQVWARRVGVALSSYVQTKTEDGGWIFPSFLSEANTTYRQFSGSSANQTRIVSGEVDVLNFGPAIVSAFTWTEIPDIAPGNGVEFVSIAADEAATWEIRWTERRPPGVQF